MNILNKNEKIKFLIIRLSSIGDIILTTPLIRAIRNNYPNAIVDYLAVDKFSEATEANPHINKLIKYSKSWTYSDIKQVKNEIISRQGKYDFIIDLQNNPRSRIFAFGLSDKIFRIPKRRLHKLCLVNFKRSPFETISIVDNYFKCLKYFGIKNDGLGCEVFPDDNFTLPTLDNKALVCVAPGAQHFTKKYPADKYVAAINALGKEIDCQFILLGGKGDFDLCESIRSEVESECINLAGITNIRKSAAVLSKSSLLICNDTGTMHLSAAVKTPIVAIFGSTVQELGFAPHGSVYRIIETDEPCRPCSHIGRANCPKSHFNCMNKISPNAIVRAALEIIKK
jgi:heptosyltransferase-2